MNDFIEFIAYLSAVSACALSYLASPRQLLLRKPLKKRAAWASFALLIAMATLAFSTVHGAIAGTLLTLAIVMTAWPCLVFAIAHWGHRPLRLAGIAVALCTGLAVLEWGHVA